MLHVSFSLQGPDSPPIQFVYWRGLWLLLDRWSGGWRVDPDSKEDGFFYLVARPWVMICIYYTLLGGRKHDLNSCLSHGFDLLNPSILIRLPSPIPKCL